MTTGLRKAELRPVSSAEVMDPLTVRLRLSAPYAPLLAFLAGRSGMMLSPQAIARLGDNVANHPVSGHTASSMLRPVITLAV